MASALVTVQDYITEARVLLQDQVAPYRYPDDDLLTAFNMAVLDSRRLRPDLWIGVTTLPSFTAVDPTTVNIDSQYRTAFVFYICGSAQMRDEEETQDTRAAAFMTAYKNILVGGVG
jgi:hypothetical protein